MTETIALVAIILGAIVVLYYCFKKKGGLFKFVINSVIGIGALFLLNFFGLNLSVNIFSAGVAAVLGIPGVIALVVTSFLG